MSSAALLRVDSGELRRVCGAFPTGVTVVAALVSDRPIGLTANSFVSVSLEPPLVSVCLRRNSTTWPALRTAAHLGVSVLAADQEEVSRSLATRRPDRFAAVRWWSGPSGEVLVQDASAWLVCGLDREVPAGDHDIALLTVHEVWMNTSAPPLVFHHGRYRQLARPAGGENVPPPSVVDTDAGD